MTTAEKELLAALGDFSKEAVGIRLRAAREVSGLLLDEIARGVGTGMTKQKIANAERGDNLPPYALMRYFYRQHRIDFNFLIHGDFAQLPSDVQERLFPALEVARNEGGQKEGSDQLPTLQPKQPRKT